MFTLGKAVKFCILIAKYYSQENWLGAISVFLMSNIK